VDGVRGESQRWQGPKSSFPWEQEALDYVKGLMPDAEPYRAWQTFTFTAASGHVREVDLFIATPGGLALVEIKSHPGVATNNGSTWLFRDGNTTRTIENPLHFTDLKCKELKSQLEKAARELRIREPVPRIEPVVFLSAQTLVCRFDDFQRPRVFGRDDRMASTTLGGIWRDYLNQPPAGERNRVTPSFSRQLPKLMQKIGIARLHRARKVGPYELDAKSFDSGPTWADYLASNPSLPNDYPRRVRVYLTEQGSTEDDRKSTQRAARREYLALQDISHDGIVRAEAYSDELRDGPAVVFRHGAGWQRLDHFMASQTEDGLPLETRLEMIRQLAEALDHAHRRHLYHRALAPRSVYIEMDGRYPRLRIADWQVAARPQGTTTSGNAVPGRATRGSAGTLLPNAVTLLKHVELSAGAYIAPEFGDADVPPALLDVFGLGALSFLILTGQPPAESRQQLAARLAANHALVPSAIADSVSPAMDDLVEQATQRSAADRTDSVRVFLRGLDAIEDELTSPEAPQEADPLTAGKGDLINGWTVERVLGKGSTSRALLMSQGDDGNKAYRVYKVALSDSAARRLAREAEQLHPLNDSHVARLLDPPFEAGPLDHRRTVLGLEYIEGDTLAEEIRRQGPFGIHELEQLGDDLFQAVKFLDRRGIWHRDIKPDNLALRQLPRKGRELVLLDFSLAGTPDSEIGVGTKDYIDPFLGKNGKAGQGRRDHYDQAAELYAVAATLHEMASGELPSWGDDMADPDFLDPDEEAQLAEDLFDPVARDGLVEFFRVALHRDAARRFGSLEEMTRAWTDVFRDLETVPPLTTSATEDTADGVEADVKALRAEAIRTATPPTPLIAAGLSPHALSVAQGKLSLSTAGDLARVPAKRITRLRGIGSVPRYELVRLSREWRQRFNLTESGLPRPDVNWRPADSGLAAIVGSAAEAETEAKAGGPGEDQDLQTERAGAGLAEELTHLPVDEVVRRLVPSGAAELSRVIGLPPATGGGTGGGFAVASPWAGRQEVARVTGLPEQDVAAYLERLRKRWDKSVTVLTTVRDDLVEILAEHGRIMGWRQLAIGLLARRGSELGDPAERLHLAAICVRAAVDTEERREGARLMSRRLDSAPPGGAGDDRVVIALRDTGDDGLVPAHDDLIAYAELLGEQADLLSGRDPLPSITEVRQALRDVPAATHAIRLSDADLVLLAAAASAGTAATPRLELYPRDLTPLRALKISQAGSIADGATEAELVRRVLGRFPDLQEASRPAEATISDLLRQLGYDVTRGSDRRLYIRSTGSRSGSRSGSRGGSWGGSPADGSGAGAAASLAVLSVAVEAMARAHRRLAEARTRGGFIALKVPMRAATANCAAIAALDGVRSVNVTTRFVRLLKEAVAERGRPQWETVLAADSPDASPAARNGFAQLLQKTWARLESEVRDAGNGSMVLLHDAAPLARYGGGLELLSKLVVAARDAAESPHGLWLLCPMEDPQGFPLLDRKTVGVIPGDAEQLYVPEGFGSGGTDDGARGGEGLMAS
jgi:serine/threonine protein kinase